MFQFLFKYPAAVFSKGKLVLLGPWPGWLLAVAIIVLAAILGAVIWREHGHFLKSLTRARVLAVWLLQSATVAILLLLLWQPAISVTALRPQQNIVAVVVDNSTSMGVADDGDARERQALWPAHRSLRSARVAPLTPWSRPRTHPSSIP